MSSDESLKSRLEGESSERAMLGTVGFIFYTATSIASVYSEVLVTASSSSPVVFGGLRSLVFCCMALTYLVFFRLLRRRDAFVRSRVPKVAFFLMQILLPLLVLAESALSLEVPLPYIAIAWACWGFANAFFACSWVDRQSDLGEPGTRGNNYWSFALAGCIVVGVLSMSSPAHVVAIVAMNIASFVLLLRDPYYPPESTSPSDGQWKGSKGIYRKNGSYVMFVDGALIGIVACCLILWLADYGFPQSFMGLTFLATALVFYILRKLNPALLSLEHSQLVFLPALVCGILLMEIAAPPWQVLVAFIVFSVIYLFDYVNSSILALRGKLLSISACYCFSKGRIFMVLGQGIGWACGAFLSTEIGASVAPIFAIVLVALICLYITIAAIYPEKYPLIVSSGEPEPPIGIEESEPPVVFERPYKQKCSRIAEAYDLTPREGEILFYLAKGRNAKHIAGQLFVAERTVKTHMYHIYQKFGTHSQQELIDKVESYSQPEKALATDD